MTRLERPREPGPAFGAWPDGEGTRFRVWAPAAQTVDLVVESASGAPQVRPLTRGADGTFAGYASGVGAGTRYRYRLDGAGPFPDPASRWQPEGVHGASVVVDPQAFTWSDAGWAGVALEQLVVYEVHVGTFSAAGTFAGVIERLPHVKALGVTAIELMPVADFPGRRNWGYDGVALFAPARCYGAPDDLRRLVDEAHRHGLAVLLDVVYNHLGPDGAYLAVFSPYCFTDRHASPWGAAMNVDGEESGLLRAFFVDNARHWIREYHVDGLRLDATHAIQDDSPLHILQELAGAVHATPDRPRPLVIAEDHRNLAHMVRPSAQGGWGLDAVWADDFHHQVRRLVAGDADGYYRDFSGTTADVAETLRRGWFFTGQWSQHLHEPRGTDPAGLSPSRFVICLQNHDQVGNRAFGERLHHQVAPPVMRAATTLLLLAPQTPLLFMGQEWAASSPFLYFTDHHEELGRLVTEGRRREFAAFEAFRDPDARARIPDPQAAATFERSRLDWTELAHASHAAVLRLHRALLALRARLLPAAPAPAPAFDVEALDAGTVAMRRRTADGSGVLVISRLRGGGTVMLPAHLVAEARPSRPPAVMLTTEDEPFAADPAPPAMEVSNGGTMVRFVRPSALVLQVPVA